MKSVKRRILLLALGGTIACRETLRGRVPRLSPRELLQSVNVPDGVKVTAVDFLKLTIVSSEQWPVIAKKIADEYDRYDGFVITLGTDSLAYLSSALSLMLFDLGKPVVLTGAMNPMGFPKGDAERNLMDSITVAADDRACGAHVVFDGTIMDGACASKTNSEVNHAFESVNRPAQGVVRNGKVVWKKMPSRRQSPLVLHAELNTRVAMITLTPQLQPSFFKKFSDCDGLLIEGYGDGNVPNNLVRALTGFARRKVLVLASQCLHGCVRHRYEGGVALMGAGALTSGIMTKEMALARLMWSLGQSTRYRNARSLFQAGASV